MAAEQEQIERYFNEKGAMVESYLLDCVRQGSRGVIEKTLDFRELQDETERIMANDLPFARMSFSYIWSKVVHVAIEGGAPPVSVWKEYAKYYHKLQHCQSISSMLKLHRQIFTEFADKVAFVKANTSLLVYKVNQYIISHLDRKLTVNLLAQKLRYNRSYLSREYKKETGETILARIRREKIREAERLLLYSSQPLIDIVDRLAFCSQSHFAKIFREATGMTPLQRRGKRQNEPDGLMPEATPHTAPKTKLASKNF
jgi:AraC-like DNA-binding protein